MKKNILFSFLISLLLLDAFSQGNFGSVGTSWHYTYYSQLFQSENPLVIQSTDTVTIGGRLCNKIVMQSGFACPDPMFNYVYESNDSVYIYVPSINTFSVLYHFNASVGDSIHISYDAWGNTCYFTMVIDSIGTVNINGNTRK